MALLNKCKIKVKNMLGRKIKKGRPAFLEGISLFAA